MLTGKSGDRVFGALSDVEAELQLKGDQNGNNETRGCLFWPQKCFKAKIPCCNYKSLCDICCCTFLSKIFFWLGEVCCCTRSRKLHKKLCCTSWVKMYENLTSQTDGYDQDIWRCLYQVENRHTLRPVLSPITTKEELQFMQFQQRLYASHTDMNPACFTCRAKTEARTLKHTCPLERCAHPRTWTIGQQAVFSDVPVRGRELVGGLINKSFKHSINEEDILATGVKQPPNRPVRLCDKYRIPHLSAMHWLCISQLPFLMVGTSSHPFSRTYIRMRTKNFWMWATSANRCRVCPCLPPPYSPHCYHVPQLPSLRYG